MPQIMELVEWNSVNHKDNRSFSTSQWPMSAEINWYSQNCLIMSSDEILQNSTEFGIFWYEPQF